MSLLTGGRRRRYDRDRVLVWLSVVLFSLAIWSAIIIVILEVIK